MSRNKSFIGYLVCLLLPVTYGLLFLPKYSSTCAIVFSLPKEMSKTYNQTDAAVFNVIYLFFLPIIFFEMSLSWYSEYVGSGAGLMFDILL